MSETKNSEPICPYCRFVFEKMPSRKRKCPQCKNTVCRKSRPSDRVLRLVTEQQAEEIEQEWLQITAAKEADGFQGNMNIIANSKDHQIRKMAFAQLATYFWKKGPEYKGHVIEAKRNQFVEDLAYYAESSSIGINHVRIGYSPNTCKQFDTGQDEIYTIANALALMPLPHRGLDDGFCGCYYECVFDDELPDGYVMPRPENPIRMTPTDTVNDHSEIITNYRTPAVFTSTSTPPNPPIYTGITKAKPVKITDEPTESQIKQKAKFRIPSGILFFAAATILLIVMTINLINKVS